MKRHRNLVRPKAPVTRRPRKALRVSALVGIASLVFGVAVPAGSAPLPAEGTLANATAEIIGSGGGFGEFVDAGDLTGDGIADLVVGAPAESGRVYVFEGGKNLAGTLSIDAKSTTFEGAGADNAGIGGAVGDIDGDGNEDLLVTGPGIDGDSNGSGGAYVFYGPLEEARVDHPALEPDATLRGELAFDKVGLYESEIGDVDADGYPDIIIGAPERNGELAPSANDEWAGSVYIVYGDGTRLTGDVRLADAVELSGRPGVDRFLGRHMALGEIDGEDGRDLVVCGEAALALNGRCYVLYGGGRKTDGPIETAADASITGTKPGDVVCCAGVVDLDANGLDDIVILGWGSDGLTGSSAIFYSDRSDEGGPLTGAHLTIEADATIRGNGIGDVAGFNVSAGDLDADGIADLVVNAQCEENDAPPCDPLFTDWTATSGALYVFYGTANERLAGDLLMSDGDVRIESEHAGDGVGYSFAATGDVTGDGVDDLIIGAPGGCDDTEFQDRACTATPGVAYVVAGGCEDAHKVDHDKPKHCWK